MASMGDIHQHVMETFDLSVEEKTLLQPFLNGFNVTWARRYERFNAKSLTRNDCIDIKSLRAFG